MFKMSSFFVVLLFLVVFYNQASASEDKAKDFCIQKIADDGCNTCYLIDDFWFCTEKGCSGAVEESGKCLEYGKKDSALRNQGQSQEQNQDQEQGYCIEKVDQYGCNTCYLSDGYWVCTEMGCSGPKGPGFGSKEPGKCLLYAK